MPHKDPEVRKAYMIAYNKKYSLENIAYQIEYRKKNGKILNQRAKEKYDPQWQRESNRKYYSLNKKKIIDINNRYTKKRRLIDPGFLIMMRLRSRMGMALKFYKCEKLSHTRDILGCTVDEWKIHLESKFKSGMTWDNRSKWEIDHIMPLKAFDLTKIENQKKAFHFSNTQPLWKKENRSKRDSIPVESPSGVVL